MYHVGPFTPLVTTVAPTCLLPGVGAVVCHSAECKGGKVAENWPIAPLGPHKFGAWQDATDHPCATGGMVRYCQVFLVNGLRCNAPEYDGNITFVHDHQPDITPPTCYEEGYTTYLCSRIGCDDGYVADRLPALNHQWGAWAPSDGTQVPRGYDIRFCQRGNGCEAYESWLITYAITYTLNDGAHVGTPNGYTVEDEFPISIADPTRTDYTFQGWKVSGGLPIEKTAIGWAIPAGTLGNLALEALWLADIYTIAYELAGGEHSQTPSSYNATQLPEGILDPTRLGYEFEGWTVAFDNPALSTLSDEIGWSIPAGTIGNITLTAVWSSAHSYDIVYVMSDTPASRATNPNTAMSYTVEDLPLSVSDPSRPGYDFVGWTVTGGLTITDPVKGLEIPERTTGNITLTARWSTAIEYTITYVLGGGTYAGAPSKYTVEDLPMTIDVPTRPGYNFLGWTAAGGEFTGSVGTDTGWTIPAVTTGDIQLTARWSTAIAYTITYELNGGTHAQTPASYNVTQLPMAIADPARLGYNFLGWTVAYTNPAIPNVNGAKSWSIPVETTGAITLTAQWSAPIAYSISYELNGGSHAQTPATYNVTQLPMAIADPARVLHVFKGWTVTGGASYPNAGISWAIPPATTGNLALRANWVHECDEYGHIWDNGAMTTPPTCMAQGVRTYTCVRDPSHKRTEPVPIDPSAHRWLDNWGLSYLATCMAEGQEIRYCQHGCGETQTRPTPIVPTAHAWSPWFVSVPVRCESDGEETRICAYNADHVETRVLTALGHLYLQNDWAPTADAILCEQHQEVHYCRRVASDGVACGEPEYRTAAALPHHWVSLNEEEHCCSYCGLIDPHRFTYVGTGNGLHLYLCPRCGDLRMVPIPGYKSSGGSGLAIGALGEGLEGILGASDDMQTSRLDLVTDEHWVFQDCYVDVGIFNGVNVFRVTALPNAQTGESDLRYREDGRRNPRLQPGGGGGQYGLRYLVVSQTLIAEMQWFGVQELWFEMEDACLRIPISAFTSDEALEMMQKLGFEEDKYLFALMIVPDPKGESVKKGGKAYSVGLFARDDDLFGNAAPDLFDIAGELGGQLRLMAREEQPEVAIAPEEPDLI